MSPRLVVLLLILCVTTATACSCIPMISDKELCGYDIIIRGFLLSVHEEMDNSLPNSFANKKLVYTVQVEKVIKMPDQLITKRTIEIRTRYDVGLCGKRFQLQVSYLIYAGLLQDKILTGSCDPSQQWDTLGAKDIDMINSLDALCANKSRRK